MNGHNLGSSNGHSNHLVIPTASLLEKFKETKPYSQGLIIQISI